MNKRRTTVITLIVITVLLIAAFVLYNILDERYDPPVIPNPSGSSTEENSSGGDSQEAEDLLSNEAAKNEDTAPDFTVYDPDGNEVTLSSFVGRPVVLNFWASWCGPCLREMPYFEGAYQEYGESVEFLMINMTDGIQETKKRVGKYIEDNSYTFPYYLDTKLSAANAYNVTAIPMTVIVASDGTLVDSVKGTLSREMLYVFIDKLLQNEKNITK